MERDKPQLVVLDVTMPEVNRLSGLPCDQAHRSEDRGHHPHRQDRGGGPILGHPVRGRRVPQQADRSRAPRSADRVAAERPVTATSLAAWMTGALVVFAVVPTAFVLGREALRPAVYPGGGGAHRRGHAPERRGRRASRDRREPQDALRCAHRRARHRADAPLRGREGCGCSRAGSSSSSGSSSATPRCCAMRASGASAPTPPRCSASPARRTPSLRSSRR